MFVGFRMYVVFFLRLVVIGIMFDFIKVEE